LSAAAFSRIRAFATLRTKQIIGPVEKEDDPSDRHQERESKECEIQFFHGTVGRAHRAGPHVLKGYPRGPAQPPELRTQKELSRFGDRPKSAAFQKDARERLLINLKP
jgi:hypothetical protein